MNGKTIKHLRQITGFTQSQLADKLGIHQTHIGKWELEEIAIQPNHKKQLLSIFECKGYGQNEVALFTAIFERNEGKS